MNIRISPPKYFRQLLVFLTVLLLLSQTNFVAITSSTTQKADIEGYGITEVLDANFKEINDKDELDFVDDQLAIARDLYKQSTLNITELDENQDRVDSLNASEEIDATFEENIIETNIDLTNRGFTPTVVDDPEPIRAAIMDYILGNPDLWPGDLLELDTIFDFFTDTYLIYYEYDYNQNGTIWNHCSDGTEPTTPWNATSGPCNGNWISESQLIQADLLEFLAGASIQIITDAIMDTIGEGIIADFLIGFLDGLDESGLAWEEIDIDGDGIDDMRARMVPILSNIDFGAGLDFGIPPVENVSFGTSAGLRFDLEPLGGTEIEHPIEVSVIRGLTYTTTDAEDVTYVWTVNSRLSHMPEEYHWEALIENFGVIWDLTGGGINPGDDLSALAPPYIISYGLTGGPASPQTNGLDPELILTPGYVRYDWNSVGDGAPAEDAMEDMTFLEIGINNRGEPIPADFSLRIYDQGNEAEEGDEIDGIEVFASNNAANGIFDFDFTYFEHNRNPEEINPFFNHITARMEGVPTGDIPEDGRLASVWLEARNETNSKGSNWTAVELYSNGVIESFTYGDYEYMSETDEEATWDNHDYRLFTGIVLKDIPQYLFLEGSFLIFSDVDPITPDVDFGGLTEVANFLNYAMVTIASKLYSIGLVLRAIPGAALGISLGGEGEDGAVDLYMRTERDLDPLKKAYIGEFSVYLTSHAYLDLNDNSEDNYLTIYNQTAFLADNSPNPARAAVSQLNQNFTFSGRLRGIGDIHYESKDQNRTVTIDTDSTSTAPFRVYFESADENLNADSWANISLSNIPDKLEFSFGSGAFGYDGGEVVDSIILSSFSSNTYSKFTLEHIPEKINVGTGDGDFFLNTDSWFNFSFIITNVTENNSAKATLWDDSLYDDSYVLLTQNNVEEEDWSASLSGRLNWLDALELDNLGNESEFRLFFHQAAVFKVGILDTTDYGENSAKGVNGYLSVEPLPTELVFTISSNDEAEGPGGELGNITGLSDISRILSELADLGRSLADIISEVSINLVSDVDSVESSLKFDYNIEEEVNIVAWLNKGDISLLEEEERWVQGVWSSQIETDDGIVLAARLYLVGLPRALGLDYASNRDDIDVNLTLEGYNKEGVAEYLLFDTNGLLGPNLTAYIGPSISDEERGVPQSLDLSIVGDLVVNSSADNFTVDGYLNISHSSANNDPLGPIYLEVNEGGSRPYSIRVLIPEIPNTISIHLMVSDDNVGISYNASDVLGTFIVEVEIGDTADLHTDWYNGVSFDISEDNDVSLRAFLVGLPSALLLNFYDPSEGGAWLDLNMQNFNAAPAGYMNDLTLDLKNLSDMDILVHIGDLPRNFDLTGDLFVSSGGPSTASSLGISSIDLDLGLNSSAQLNEIFVSIEDVDTDLILELYTPTLPQILTLNASISGDVAFDLSLSSPIEEVILFVDLGDTESLNPYWTHGVVFLQNNDSTAFRLYEKGEITAAHLNFLNDEPKDIYIRLENWSPDLLPGDAPEWAIVDVDTGVDGSSTFLYIDDVQENNNIEGHFIIATDEEKGIDTDASFDVTTSSGIGSAYIQAINRTRPTNTELYLDDLPDDLSATVLSGRSIEINYTASDPTDYVWVYSSKKVLDNWVSAYALVHDVSTYMNLAVLPYYGYDMDRPFILQGLPTVTVDTSDNSLDVILIVDPGYSGGFTGTALDAENVGNNTFIGLNELGSYVISAPNGVDKAYYRLLNAPTTPQFSLNKFEIFADNISYVELTTTQLFGVYPIFALHKANGGNLTFIIGSSIRPVEDMEFQANSVMLDLRTKEFAGLPILPTWLGISNNGINGEFGNDESHYIMPEPVLSLVYTVLGELL